MFYHLLSKAESARQLGYDGYPTIWKKYRELDRIMAEKALKQDSAKDFRKGLEYKPNNTINSKATKKEDSQREDEEGR